MASDAESAWEQALAREFGLDEDVLHLNHAGVGPWPNRTVQAIREFAEENRCRGSEHFQRWVQTETKLRGQLRALINAESSQEIALLKSTSEALSAVAYGLEWQLGDRIVTARQEFPSNRIVWESLRTRYGVEVVEVDLSTGDDPEALIEAAMTEGTRLVALSAVQYASGLRLDLERIGRACRARGALFCVDGIQQIGALPFDVRAIGADFVAADGHKWMLAPEGLALFYCRAELRDRLVLRQYGWHMVEHLGDFERSDWQPADSARRFECGSANNLGIHALSASLGLLLEAGMAHVGMAVLEKTDYLVEALQAGGFEVLSDRSPTRRSGIVVFRHPGCDSETLYRELQASGVVCALRGGGVRFSPHFHTPRQTLDRAVEAAMRAVHRSGAG
ncbi:MAG: aminotransferase class V-fold PLP-dependent enzyme [Gammaproteobacteria bacterium]|nr:aminotransferase class V-fold PLP-dependent enzyme [Gammaproteobacteria bacterium]MDX5374486.1 aminotransferase class V-fold PLP-dependent enzyme [Gammaproteobacteria bacterium]